MKRSTFWQAGVVLALVGTLFFGSVLTASAQPAPAPAQEGGGGIVYQTLKMVLYYLQTSVNRPQGWAGEVFTVYPRSQGWFSNGPLVKQFAYYAYVDGKRVAVYRWYVPLAKYVPLVEGATKFLGALPPLGQWYCLYTDPQGNHPAGCSGSVTDKPKS